MIAKSLSRKTPSFSQLAGYMSESGYMNSEKADSHYEIYQHCFSRGSHNIAEEFRLNSELLSKRKNGNYLYHEILSITLEDGVGMKYAKESLRALALEYIRQRCPRNMVYGCLHDDHADHIHYHLMISANERGSKTRYWLTKKQLDNAKRHIEEYCLKHFPELKQRAVMTATNTQKRESRQAAEEKRRKGALERRESVKHSIFAAMSQSRSLDEFIEKLAQQNAHYYTRGKNYGVEVQHDDGKVKKYRFSTLEVHSEFENYLSTLEALEQAEQYESEPVIEKTSEPSNTESLAQDETEQSIQDLEADFNKLTKSKKQEQSSQHKPKNN